MASYEGFVLFSLLFSFIPMIISLRSITPDISIHYNETLVSAAGTFEAGFFSLRNSQSLYFCIWYKNLTPRTIVWVANRDTPLDNNPTAIFKVTDGGNPIILYGSGTIVWSSNASITVQMPVLLLLDTGNLVVQNGSSTGNIVWQSFDYPGDTLLPGMILHLNRVSGVYNSLTSWKNTGDPSRGDFSYHLVGHGFPQLVISKGSTLLYRLGSWNGFFFSGIPWETLYSYFTFSFVLTEQEVHFHYEPLNSSIVSRYMITPTGAVQRFLWSYQTETWQLFLSGPVDQCDNYAFCGANSECNVNNSPQCECLTGYTPKSPEKWNSLDRTDGCVRKVNLDCDNRDGFLKYTGMKLPDTSSSWLDKNMTLQECEIQCLKNCSCIAYSNLDIRDGGSGCMIWFNNIMDMRKENSEGQEIHIRVAASELDNSKNNSNKKKLAGILGGVGTLILGITIAGYVLYLKRKKLRKSGKDTVINKEDDIEKYEKENIDLPTFDFSTISNATDQFSPSNILGEGGYGPVYKGELNGREIAVKRLSLKSGQGPQEFKNEVLLIANLQHRNLVKLLGCCIQSDERILIYEYMPNRSLDKFIFDHIRSKELDWNKRLHIISGIARGLVYLHQDSRLRIIHRDLKTSNILLDNDMNPKISDFGLARAFGGDHAEANTIRVVGTHGYMPPEYAVYGSFSVKTDVFSFGVIVLEMISGRKNREFFDTQHNLNLLGYAWRLWSEDRPLGLIADTLSDSVIEVEALRCIQIGLLCVQERQDDRPDMSSVVLMLNGERALPNPRQPGFYPHEVVSSSSKHELSSTNEVSISLLQPR
ncbi:G-type lectin S-receptor-like serine/threonine-protein kinase At4g27290 [Gastrolobium bilobum]|uniref:G-type lectin S-receptor-like serine/threonine-protein kinase At4g27290 n=1 Tax=Gastrolobium bilobum TaxID=150636 RepID=UPI002AB09747|nr:G-type lectin S-receptor-like serine/threonine-protein kinase At4g27290 [Gastrolobium bilobum]